MSDENLTFTSNITMPEYVGCYVVGESLHISIIKKPLWIHRFFMKLFLGWEWHDE